MAPVQPRTMPGVLELLPRDQVVFQSMLDRIRGNFERFGFLPVETPVMELAEVLLTKEGGETERQVYFVQSTGALERGEAPELALRFDLTVPLARYVAEHERELAFPFRRYQIQRVYRGERAQRGRFREFYQCDIDIIGKDALSVRHDAEIPAVIWQVFHDLAVGPFTIQLNHRKLMRGWLQRLGVESAERQALVLREVDKLDKRGPDAVRQSLAGGDCNLGPDEAASLLEFVDFRSGSLQAALQRLESIGGGNDDLEEGRAELTEVLQLIAALGVPESDFMLNLAIARGLDYYTGIVYETTLDDHPQIGSVCSGGRYADLASHYTRSKLPGVGISIGATRLYWQLREAGILPAGHSTVDVLVAHMDDAGLPSCLDLARALRADGLNTETVMEAGRLGRQFRYADRSGIRFVAVLGPDEIAAGTVTLKDLQAGDQFTIPRAEAAAALRARLSA